MDLRLQDELKQRKAFGSLEQEALLNVVRTSSVLNDSIEQLLKPFGVSLAQYNVLRILRGSSPTPLCRNDIRDRMINRMPDMTRLLDRMEEAGLVARARESEDRRMVLTRLTDEGQRVLDAVDPLLESEHKRLLGKLSSDEQRTLISLLSTIRNSV